MPNPPDIPTAIAALKRNRAADEAIAALLKLFPESGIVIVQLQREPETVTVSANVDSNGLLVALRHIALRINDMKSGRGGH